MAFDKLCIAEGGLNSHLAVERATSNAMECLKRGHPFAQYHDWKQCTELLYFERTYKNIFAKVLTIERHEAMELKAATDGVDPAATPVERLRSAPLGAAATSLLRKSHAKPSKPRSPRTTRNRQTRSMRRTRRRRRGW